MFAGTETSGLGCLRALAAELPLPVRVSGSCMAPALNDGEVVGVAPARFYLPGDVIAFRHAGTGRLRLHRVLGWRPQGLKWALVVQGDRCATHDGPVAVEHVVGKVRSVEGELLLQVTTRDRLWALRRWLSLAVGWLARRLR